MMDFGGKFISFIRQLASHRVSASLCRVRYLPTRVSVLVLLTAIIPLCSFNTSRNIQRFRRDGFGTVVVPLSSKFICMDCRQMSRYKFI